MRCRIVFLATLTLAVSALAADNWVQQFPTPAPTVRVGASMAYDSLHQRAVLFGGINFSNTLFGETWTWDGANWTLAATTGPVPRAYFPMAYDEQRQQVVLFGGRIGTTGIIQGSDTWVWDGSAWTQKFPVNSPSPRSHSAMTYDAARQQIVLFGGESPAGAILTDTWVWDGTNWTQKSPATIPDTVDYQAMAYDAVHQQVVLMLGEIALTNHTWTWDGSNWTQQNPATAITKRIAVLQMAYDSVRQRVVEFGGFAATTLNDTWTWDGSTWLQLTPTNNPPGRAYFAMAYDSGRQQILIFGGLGGAGGTALGDTWTLDSGPSAAQTQVTINVPASVQFTFNNVTYTGSHTISVAPGSYPLSTASPQTIATGTQAVWLAWTDAGDQTHSVSVGSSPITITGLYTTQYLLTTVTAPRVGGTILPASGYYTSGTSVPVSASANSGYAFSGFTGDCMGTGPCSVSMTAPRTVAANFTAIGTPVTINVPSGILFTFNGQLYIGSQTVVLAPGAYSLSTPSPQLVTATSQLRFGSWSNGGAQSQLLLVGSTPATVTGTFITQYLLTFSANRANEGTVMPLSSGPFYDVGTVVVLQATAGAGFEFEYWTGDCFGSTPACVVTMNGPRSVTGNFGLPHNWSQLFPPSKLPQPRSDQAVAYDAAHQEVLMFGGLQDSTILGDTWLWSGSWIQRTPANSPSPRWGAMIAYDSARSQLVLFGGLTATGAVADTWVWDFATANWIPKNVVGPPARLHGGMAFDGTSARVVLFGGSTINGAALADTWAWNGSQWSNISPIPSPGARFSPVLVNNAARQRVVLFGGYRITNSGGVPLFDTWEFDGSHWVLRGPATNPHIQSPAGTYDPSSEQVLVFGLDDNFSAVTWGWDGNNWLQKSPPVSPPARLAHQMTHDAIRQQILLFGGIENSTGRFLADTWTWLTPVAGLQPQTPSIVRQGNGNYAVTVTLFNNGNVADTNAIVSASLGGVPDNSAFVGAIEPGTSAAASFKFKISAVTGPTATLVISGVYNANGGVGIPFSASFTLPLP